jgi:CRP-like cAMP-binding protein
MTQDFWYMEMDGVSGTVNNATIVEKAALVLAGSELFKGLSETAQLSLARRAGLISVERREAICRQGDEGRSLFLLRSGRVRLVRRAQNDRELTLDYRTAGDLIGEEALVTRTYQYDARVAERAEVLTLPTPVVQAVAGQESALAARLLSRNLTRRLQIEGRVEALLTRTVESRVAEFLADMAVRYGVPEDRGVLIGIKLTHQEIASYVGSTRETVTLILGDLKRRGFLHIEQRRLTVHDVDALRQLT